MGPPMTSQTQDKNVAGSRVRFEATFFIERFPKGTKRQIDQPNPTNEFLDGPRPVWHKVASRLVLPTGCIPPLGHLPAGLLASRHS